mgnify:CR=1 FL=1
MYVKIASLSSGVLRARGLFYLYEEEKTYKTYRQQLAKLRSRGMEIKEGAQGARAMRILEQENYYNVINGYKSLFLEREATDVLDEKYKEGTTFNEVYALYCFDRYL